MAGIGSPHDTKAAGVNPAARVGQTAVGARDHRASTADGAGPLGLPGAGTEEGTPPPEGRGAGGRRAARGRRGLDWIGLNNMGGRATPMGDSYASEPELD